MIPFPGASEARCDPVPLSCAFQLHRAEIYFGVVVAVGALRAFDGNKLRYFQFRAWKVEWGEGEGEGPLSPTQWKKKNKKKETK